MCANSRPSGVQQDGLRKAAVIFHLGLARGLDTVYSVYV